MLKFETLLLLFLLALTPRPSSGNEMGGQALRAQDGAKTMDSSCTGVCHGPGLIAQQRLDRAGWTREVDKMIRWGASVPAAEKDGLIHYLAQTFHSSRPLPNSARFLPEGQGVDLARTACLGCHDDQLLIQQRLDRSGWAEQVEKMIQWGAFVPAARKDELLDYLSAHFAK